MLRRLVNAVFAQVERLDRHLRHRMTPAGVLAASVAGLGLIIGIDASATVGFQLFAWSTALLLVSFLLSLRVRARLGVRRQLPRYARAGETVAYRLQVENLGSRALGELRLWDRLADQPWPPSPGDVQANASPRLPVTYYGWLSIRRIRRGAETQPATLIGIRAGQRADVRMELRLLRRGPIELTHVIVGRPDPLGLLNALATIPERSRLLVLPRRRPCPALELGASTPDAAPHREVQPVSIAGQQETIVHLREYRPGDSPRLIHWRSYAKRGELVVKEYEDESILRYALFVDTLADSVGAPRVEAAIELGAAFLESNLSSSGLTMSRTPASGTPPRIDRLLLGLREFSAAPGSAYLLELLAMAQTIPTATFEAMLAHWPTRVAASSGLICILSDYDARRQQLVELALATRRPVYAFVIGPPSVDPGSRAHVVDLETANGAA